MKNSTKSKFLAVMLLPALLGGCASKAMPAVYAAGQEKKGLATGPSVVVVDGGGGGGSSISNYQSTGYPSVYGYETHSTTLNTSIGSDVPTYSNQSFYHDVGVKVYGSNTGTSVGSTNSVKIAAVSPYFDFADVNFAMPSTLSAAAYQNTGVMTEFTFEVYRGSTRCFHASAVAETTSSIATFKDIVYDRNGTTTTVAYTSSGGTGLEQILDFSKLGKISSGLYSGSYTIKVTYKYLWIYSANSKMGIYVTTATNSASLLIDYTNPSIAMVRSGTSISVSSGSVVNSAVKVTASDTNFSALSYKIPGASYYSSTAATSYTSGTANGWYYCYATDALGNKSDEVSFYVDTIAPSGALYANGSAIASGSYVRSSFSYVASDSGSGVANVYYKAPKSSGFVAYSSGSIIPSDSGDGLYQFYSVDKAGNASSTMSVFLETAAPTVKLFRNGSLAYTGSMSASGKVSTGLYVNEGDTIRYEYSSPSGKCSCSTFAMGTNYVLTATGYPSTVYDNTVVSATGIAVTYSFTIVHKKPALSINGVEYQSGSALRFASDVDAKLIVDSAVTSGEATGTVTDGSGNKQTLNLLSGDAVSLTCGAGSDKDYRISIKDPAGNESTFDVRIDKAPSKGQWTSAGAAVADGSYVNHALAFEFDSSETTAAISKDGGAFKAYASGSEINGDGSYTVILTDEVGNTSEFRAVIDTVAPTGAIYADGKQVESGAVTNKPVYFTWDGDATCKVNGADYVKNTVIDEEGELAFVLTDKAGNSSAYRAVIDRTAPSNNGDRLSDRSGDDIAVSKWFDVTFNGSVTSFVSDSDALSYAVSLETAAYVSERQLDDVASFKETNAVADNGDPDNHDDEPRAGAYWVYKSKANPAIQLYYFDKALLDEAIRFYAKGYVSEAKYSDGTNHPTNGSVYDNVWTCGGQSLPVGNNYVLTNGGDAVSATAVRVGHESEGAVTLQYGTALGEQLKESGVWAITETDKAGNSSTYSVIIDHDAPELKVKTETYDGSKEFTLNADSMPSAGAFYLKSFAIESILDGDKWASVSVTKAGATSYYTYGDALPTIAEGGEYLIRAFDRLGHSTSFTVYISDEEEQVVFKNNADDTAVSVDVSMGEGYQVLTSLEIYRNGVKLDGVSTDKLSYVFDKDGTYEVVLKDNFGRTVTKEYAFHKALPQGTLQGVEDGGKTNQDVGFSYDSAKYFAEVYKDGELVRLDQTGFVSIPKGESGSYQIKLVNQTDADNYKTYSFTIDSIAPEVNLGGVEDGGTTNGNVTVSWGDSDVASATVSLNGSDPTPFASGTTFDKEGTYVITVTDGLGNVTEKTFVIDKTVDYEATTSDGKRIGGDATTSDDVTVTANEPATVTVIKDGEPYAYSFGDKLTEEGAYLITVEDAYGNKTSFTIVIDKTVAFGMDVADGGISNGPVSITAGEKETIILTKDGKPISYQSGEALTDEGAYQAVITDAYGNEKTVTFRIVSDSAKTSLDYTLGDGIKVVSVTKDGTPISVDGNHLAFADDGTYVVTYEQGGKTYSFTLRLDTTAPEITLNGVEDGGTVDGTVSIDGLTEEGTVQVYKDGVLIDYKLGDALKDYGSYKVVVTDALGNARTYSFTLAFQMNVWAIVLICLGAAAAVGVTATVIVKRKRLFKK
jgi:hypothetical protein